MSSIKLVKQINPTGCGIACLAMITGQSYDKVKEKLAQRLAWTPRKKCFHTKAPELLACLVNDYKVKAELAKFSKWEDIPGTAIVGVGQGSYFHWIVVSNKKDHFVILDPETAKVYEGLKKTEMKRFTSRMRSNYISITN